MRLCASWQELHGDVKKTLVERKNDGQFSELEGEPNSLINAEALKRGFVEHQTRPNAHIGSQFLQRHHRNLAPPRSTVPLYPATVRPDNCVRASHESDATERDCAQGKRHPSALRGMVVARRAGAQDRSRTRSF